MQTCFAAGGSGARRRGARAFRTTRKPPPEGNRPAETPARSRRRRRASGGGGAGGPSAVSRAFTVDPSVRAHFCDAVSALASSPRGVATAQKCCLVPLLRRVLLDDSPATRRRARAAEAFRALAQSRRGAALLCLADDDSFMTCWYHLPQGLVPGAGAPRGAVRPRGGGPGARLVPARVRRGARRRGDQVGARPLRRPDRLERAQVAG